MEDTELHSPADESKAASYKVVKYSASELPLTYRNMVISKYLRSLRAGNDFFKLVVPEAFFSVHGPYFELLLLRPEAKIRLAVLSDDPDVALGWSLTEGPKLHYVWVGGIHRRQGIGSALIREDITVLTHITKFFFPIWHNKFPKAVFNPYA